MNMNEPTKAAILYFSSSNEDENYVVIEFIFKTPLKNIKPKITNYYYNRCCTQLF